MPARPNRATVNCGSAAIAIRRASSAPARSPRSSRTVAFANATRASGFGRSSCARNRLENSCGISVAASNPASMSCSERTWVRNGAHKWIAQHNRLPAQIRHRRVERFREVQALEIRRKQDVGPDRGVEIRLRYVTRGAGYAVVDEISGQRLARTPERTRRAVVVARHPLGRRLLERAGVRTHEHRRERARDECHLKVANPGWPDRSIPGVVAIRWIDR